MALATGYGQIYTNNTVSVDLRSGILLTKRIDTKVWGLGVQYEINGIHQKERGGTVGKISIKYT
jgi:hypothetical protein